MQVRQAISYSLLGCSGEFVKQYKSPDGTLALDLKLSNEESFKEMVNIFFEKEAVLKDIYWHSIEKRDTSCTPGAYTAMIWATDMSQIKELVKRIFKLQGKVRKYQKGSTLSRSPNLSDSLVNQSGKNFVGTDGRLSSGQIIHQRSWQDCVHPSTIAEEDHHNVATKSLDDYRESTNQSTTANNNTRAITGYSSSFTAINYPGVTRGNERMVTAGNQYGIARENDSSVRGGNQSIVTVAHPSANLPHNLQKVPPVLKAKRPRSPAVEITESQSSKRPTLYSNDIIFNFIVPLPEGEGLLPGSKPDAIISPLSECSTSDLFFTRAERAWKLGGKLSAGLYFTGVRCSWDGRNRRAIVPWGEEAGFRNVVAAVRDTKAKNMKVGGKREVDVACMMAAIS